MKDLYNELLELAIYEDNIEEYKKRRSLQEGLISKFFQKKSNKKIEENYNKKKEQFIENGYKLTQDLVSSGFDIFDVIDNQEDFNKFVKATGTSLSKASEEFVLQTYSFSFFDSPDIQSKSDILKLLNKRKSEVDSWSKEIISDMINFINKCDKLIPVNSNTFYCISNKKLYSMDYKGRIDMECTVKEYLENDY